MKTEYVNVAMKMGIQTKPSDGYEVTRTKQVSLSLPTKFSFRQNTIVTDKLPSPETDRGRGHARPCSVERRHQDYYLITEKMLAAETFRSGINNNNSSNNDFVDRLPVVELRPFTKKQWRPANSVPEAEAVDRRPFTSIRSALCSRSLQFDSAGLLDPDRRATAMTPRLLQAAPGQRSTTTSPERRIQHPPLRESRDGPGEHDPWRTRPEHPDGFVSKVERQRSTVAEVTTGSSVCTQFSCLKRAMTDGDTRRQQVMKVKGRRIEHRPRKANSLYGDIEDYYRLTKSCTAPSSEGQATDAGGGGTALEIRKRQNEAAVADDVRVRVAAIQTAAYLDESIYDAFDRSSTLPSIRVRKAPIRIRKTTRNQERDLDDEENASRRSSAVRIGQLPAYRLGVTNSLHLMSHIGKPVSVEYKLSAELRSALSGLRRNKDGGSVIGGPYKIIPRYEMIQTRGDSRITTTTTATTTTTTKPFTDSRQNTQSIQNRYLSRASTRPRSDVLDSGIESTGGCYSPVKPLSRNLDARRGAAARGQHGSVDKPPITANIPTDTKGYASSDASDTNPPHPQHSHTFYGGLKHNTPQDQSETPSEDSKPEVNRDGQSELSPPNRRQTSPETESNVGRTPEEENTAQGKEVEEEEGKEGQGVSRDPVDVNRTITTERSAGDVQAVHVPVSLHDDDKNTDVDGDVETNADVTDERPDRSADDVDNSPQADADVRSQMDSSYSEEGCDDVPYEGDDTINYDQPTASTLIPAYNVN